MGKRTSHSRPLPTVYIHVEGNRALRSGFRSFFRKWSEALRGRYEFEVVPGDNNAETKKDWIDNRTRRSSSDIFLLLIDSEGTITTALNQPPQGCTSFLTSADLATGDVYFMVQLMESWFLTEPDQLASLYENSFDRGKLPAIPSGKSPAEPGERLERISKQAVEDGLAAATRNTTKGAYNRTNAKTTIAPKMIAAMSFEKIARESYHANRLLERLQSI